MANSKQNPFQIFVSAGELSGDHQGFLLLKKLKETHHLKIFGIGAKKLKSLSKEISFDCSYMSSIGFFESLLASIKIFFHLIFIIKKIHTKKIDLAIFIDSPILNIFLVYFTKKLKIPSIYYFPPAHFISSKKTAHKITSLFDFIFTPFYKDFVFYKQNQKHKNIAKVYHIQHPFFSIFNHLKKKSQNLLCSNTSSAFKKNFSILIFPGSRKQEIKKHMPMICELLKHPKLEKMNIIWSIVLADTFYQKIIMSKLKLPSNVKINFLKANSYLQFKKYDLAIAKSGTTILELALLAIPSILFYKINIFSYMLFKYFQKKKPKYIGLPNILMQEYWIPEFIQKDCNTQKILEKLILMLNHLDFYKDIFSKNSHKLLKILKKENQKSIFNVVSKILILSEPKRY